MPLDFLPARRWVGAVAAALLLAPAAVQAQYASVNAIAPPGGGGTTTPPSILTYHNDNARTGANLAETFLTPTILRNGYVDPVTKVKTVFGKMFARTVDGAVYAQPLYVPNIPVVDLYTGKTIAHNVLYVATAHNSVYAFDADRNDRSNARPLWQTNFNYSLLEINPVSSGDAGSDDISPEIGIIGTPVIDPASQTLYVVVKTRETNDFVQRLHALDLSSGAEKLGGPVVISATVPGGGDGFFFDPNGVALVPFDPLRENQQPALTLLNGVIYIAYTSHGEVGPYHGWVLGYDAATLQPVGAFNTTPNGSGGGILETGGGLAAEPGSLYLTTGNGTFSGDPADGGADFGNSVVKLTANGLGLADYFTPSNFDDLNAEFSDLGTGGIVLLPNEVGNSVTPHLMVTAGSEGKILLLNRDTGSVGGFTIGSDNVLQELPDAIGQAWSTPAYFNGTIYFQGVGDVLKAYSVANGQISDTPISQSATPAAFPGATPSISANGAQNGIVWTSEALSVASNTAPLAALRAYDAGDVSQQLYSATSLGTRDLAGPAVKYSVPTVVNGKVYVGGDRQVTVYGLTTPKPAEADRFVIAGPNVFQQNIGQYFSVTAVGPDNQPIKLNATVYLATRSFFGEGLRFVGSLRFNNEFNVVLQHSFPTPEFAELIVTDNDGHTGQMGILNLPSPANGGQAQVDHYVLRASRTVRDGDRIPLTIRAVTASNTPITVSAPVDITDSLPDSTIQGVYDSQGSATFAAQTEITFLVTVRGVGKHVFIVTDGAHSGNILITASPR